MIKFNEKELSYIKENMKGVMDIYENGTKEDLKEYIKEVGGTYVDTVLMLSTNNWKMFEQINTNKYENELVIDFCWEALGMWVWNESEFDKGNQVFEYVPDHIYCGLYEKILKNAQENND